MVCLTIRELIERLEAYPSNSQVMIKNINSDCVSPVIALSKKSGKEVQVVVLESGD